MGSEEARVVQSLEPGLGAKDLREYSGIHIQLCISFLNWDSCVTSQSQFLNYNGDNVFLE